MLIDDKKIMQYYVESYEEHNKTNLAEEGNWFIPNGFTVIQLKQIVKYLTAKDSVFLEIGTGCGVTSRFARKLGLRSISVDWPVTGGYLSIENVRKAGVEGYYVEVGREPIPVQADSMDCVLFADVIEHLVHSPKPVLAEIHRILKPGGVCIATTPNAVRLTVRLKVALGFSNWPHISEYYERPFHSGHHHEYTIQEFKEVFQRAGFEEVDFLLYEKNLRIATVKSLADLHSRRRRGKHRRGLRSHFLINFARYPLLLFTFIFPRLCSEMLIIIKKL